MSTPETAFAALVAQVTARLQTDAPDVELVDDTPSGSGQQLGDAGRVTLSLVDRGVAEGVNGFGPYYRSLEAEIEVLVTGLNAVDRRQRVSTLLASIEAALNADRSLGGAAEDCDFEPLDPARQAPRGASDLASETILITIEIHSDSQI